MSEKKTLVDEKQDAARGAANKLPELNALVVPLLKGVIYRENDERLWQAMSKLQSSIRDYVSVIGLELILDESEGYAFLRARSVEQDHDEASTDEQTDLAGPRLMARRPLTFPISLLLALLRRRLAEFDQRGGDTRLILSQDEIVQMVRVFFADGTNEAKLVSQIETHLNKIVDLGFLRKLKTSSVDDSYEVRRILKAFVDAQWLAEFDAKLDQYKRHALSLYGASDDE